MTNYTIGDRIIGALCRAIGRVPRSEVYLLRDLCELRRYAAPLALKEMIIEQQERLRELYGVPI